MIRRDQDTRLVYDLADHFRVPPSVVLTWPAEDVAGLAAYYRERERERKRGGGYGAS